MKSSLIARSLISGVAGFFLAASVHAQTNTTEQAAAPAGKDPVKEIRDFIQAKIDAKAIDKSATGRPSCRCSPPSPSTPRRSISGTSRPTRAT
ncbi:MAG: hypothetical protein U1G05_13700 [Kiritimatiellia bacterium]